VALLDLFYVGFALDVFKLVQVAAQVPINFGLNFRLILRFGETSFTRILQLKRLFSRQLCFRCGLSE